MRKETTMKHDNRWLPAVCAVLALLAAACNNVFQEPSGTSPAPAAREIPAGKGLARVSFDSPARTILPDAARLYYTLDFTLNGETVNAEIPIGEQSIECALSPGVWELSVKGYGSAEEAASGGTALVSGTARVRVNGGEVSDAVVALGAGQGETGTGILRYSFGFSGNAGYLELAMLPLTGSGSRRDLKLDMTDSGIQTAAGVLGDLAAGYYRLSITVTLYDRERDLTLKAGRVQVVHIYGSLESEINMTFAPGDFAEIPTFVSLEDMKAWLAGKEMNDPENPYYVALSVPVSALTSGTDSLGGLFAALAGRYAAVDLGECSGTAIAAIGSAPNRGYATRLVSLVLPKNLSAIGNYNFSGCTLLRSVKLPPVLQAIGPYAFQNNDSLTSLELPPAITQIGSYAFRSCDSLESLDLPKTGPDAVIGTYAFSECPLVSVKLPGTVKTIDASAFSSCSLLQSVEWPEAPAGTAIGASAFSNCLALSSLSLPATLASIGASAFSGCAALPSIELPQDLTTLGASAFANCYSLSSVSIPDGVSALAAKTFENSTNLLLVRIPPSITSIAADTFSGCDSLRFDTTENAKYSTDSSLRMLIENGNTIVAMPGFSGEVDIPAGISYGATLQNNDRITGLTIRGPVPATAFLGCASLKKVTIIDAGDIANSAFGSCTALESVEFGGAPATTSIGDYAFANCAALKSLTLPATLTTLGASPFSRCSSLLFAVDPDNVTFNADPSGMLLVQKSNNTIVAAPGAFGEITIPPGVVIPNNCFKDNTRITAVTLTGAITGTYAFAGCAALERVTIIDAGNISSYAFSGCARLNEVAFTETPVITTIESYAFQNCAALTGITLPASLTTISDKNAFAGCTSICFTVEPGNTTFTAYSSGIFLAQGSNLFLASGASGDIEIPLGINIPASFFTGNTLITGVTINGGAIGISAFQNCGLLKTLTINNAATIGTYAFDNCASLETVAFTGTPAITTFNNYIFQNCVSLTELPIPASLTTISDKNAFNGCASLVFVVDPGHSVFSTDDSGMLLIQKSTGNIFAAPGASGDIVIPTGVNVSDYTIFRANTRITGVSIDGGTVANHSFYECTNIVRVSINNLNTLGQNVFGRCSSLRELTFTGTPTASAVGYYSFAYCSALEEVELPSGITSTGDGVFADCVSLAKVTLPATLTTIGNYSFSGCPLTAVDLPSGLTSIGADAFSGCPLTAVDLPSGLTSIGAYAFSGCPLTTLTLPSGLLTISVYAFRNCTSLRWVKWPVAGSGTVSVGLYAFAGCTKLEKVELPNPLNTINTYAFSGCAALRVVIIRSTVQPALPTNATAFSACTDPAFKIYKDSSLTYSAAYWTDTFFTGKIVDIDGSTPNPDEWI
jgi:hypothetical protein